MPTFTGTLIQEKDAARNRLGDLQFRHLELTLTVFLSILRNDALFTFSKCLGFGGTIAISLVVESRVTLTNLQELFGVIASHLSFFGPPVGSPHAETPY